MQSSNPGCCAVFHRGLRDLPGLEVFLDRPIHFGMPPDARQLAATAGWGMRKYSCRAREVAEARGVPFLCLEDGFLRSVDSGATDAPLSIVVDDVGIYYNSGAPSRLEALIRRALTDSERERARDLATAWREARVSKYNFARERMDSLPDRYVLVADQSADDASIRHGAADASSFPRMLAAAISENPECAVLLKVHPDVIAGRKRAHFDLAAAALMPRVRVMAQDAHPAGVLERAKAVYVVTSQIGFEALLWGKPVHAFGMPFYAGWGLTCDALATPERRTTVPLENLIHAALVEYPRYLDPETGSRCEVERLLEWLAFQRRMRERFPAAVHAIGFSRWKKPVVRSFFQGSEVTFHRRARPVPEGAITALWGRKTVRGEMPANMACVRLEDGFLRSVGLGADLIMPVSWVMDPRGIYYDATCPSALEHLLETAEFPPSLLDRASRLRQRILASGLTKYNVGNGVWKRPAGATRVILVPGQVESDASIRLGAPAVKTCIGLLRAVREANPDAYIIYKHHPDVVAGLRPNHGDEISARRWCDEVLTDLPMGDLLPLVDETHVLTSLTGFEALLRGKKVTCYGQPFFAGWGLTTDLAPVARRTRRLTVNELAAATLILYPTYVSQRSGRFTTPESALDELIAWRNTAKTASATRKALGWLRRLRAKVLRSPSTRFGPERPA